MADVSEAVGEPGSKRRRVVMIGGGLALLAVVVVWLRGRTSAAAAADTSGYTYPQLTPGTSAGLQGLPGVDSSASNGPDYSGALDTLGGRIDDLQGQIGDINGAQAGLAGQLDSEFSRLSGQLGDIAGSLANAATKASPGPARHDSEPTLNTPSPVAPVFGWSDPPPSAVQPAPAAYNAPSYSPTNPTVYFNPATPAPVPSAPAPSIAAAMAQVGGGVAPPARTTVGQQRAFSSFDAASQAKLKAGGEVVGGDNRVFKFIVGADGTPHATSIGMYGQVV